MSLAILYVLNLYYIDTKIEGGHKVSVGNLYANFGLYHLL